MTSATRHSILASLLFLAPRVALLFVRQPFYDELFTRWISAQPFLGIINALRLDSGPPLYYFVMHALGDPPIEVARVVSLLCATVAFVLIYRRSPLAALLLAVYPPAVLMSVDARAYAMCAMFVTIALLHDSTIAYVLAAYTHYYGFLFLPLLLLKKRRSFVIACVAVTPALWLALHQPPEALAWNSFNPLFVLVNPSFAGIYADALLRSAPIVLVVAAMALLIFALRRTWSWSVVIPIALTLVAALVGRAIYFPLRFESVIAAPLMLWIASARPHRIVAASLMIIGAIVITMGTLDHAKREPDDCTRAARMVREHAHDPAMPVIASGYCYLESLTDLPASAFPIEQGQHPGWWRALPAEALDREARSLPQRPFIWIGSQFSPEVAAIRRARRTEVRARAGNVIVLTVY